MRRRRPDFWTEHPLALKDLLLEGLEREDRELLRGIQCFSAATTWTHLQSMEGIINTLFEMSVDVRRQASNQWKYLKERESFLRERGLYEKVKERAEILEQGRIPIPYLKSSFSDLSRRRFSLNLKYLGDCGFLKIDKSGGWAGSVAWLPSRYWDAIIEDTLQRGEEDGVYSSSLGTMIAHSCQNKTVETLKMTVLALKAHGEEITQEDFKETYIAHGVPLRKLNNFKRRDALKNPKIKAIAHEDERKIRWNREMVRTNKKWIELTNQRLRRISP